VQTFRVAVCLLDAHRYRRVQTEREPERSSSALLRRPHSPIIYLKRLRPMLSIKDLLEQTKATPQETGELEDTYIFFTSDNGFHLG
jgi:hypothetical protein